MQEYTAKPAVRFAGFTDAWEQRKLTEFVDFFSGLTYTPNDVQESGTLVLRSSNVSNGEIVDADNVFVDSAVVNSDYVREGDIIVVVRNGSRSLIGKHAQIKRFMPNTVIGAFMTGIRSQCPSFTNALLNTHRFDEEVAMNMGATINQITGYMFSKMEFAVPNIEEQKQIGLYFENIDNLITLHQRKYDKLVNIKKAMLGKMFPKNGTNVPEIRFAGFTDAWGQRNWVDTVDISKEMVDPKSGDFDELPHIAPGNMESFSGALYDNIKLVKDEQLISGKFHFYPGDIIYGKINPQLGKYHYSSTEGLTSADAYVLNAKNEVSQKFLFTVLQTQDFYSYSVSVSKRSGMPKINRDELNAYCFLAPDTSEQELIGSLFLNLDTLITLHQRELKHLQNIKKSCLEKMFV